MEPIRSLGIDVGGTKIAWGTVTIDGTLITSGKIPTPPSREGFTEAIQSLIREHGTDVQAVGIGMPGTLDQKRQTTIVIPNLPELADLPIGAIALEAGAPTIAVDNDARCALIAEVWQGVATGYSSAVLLTLGTGIGGAVMQKGVVRPHPTDITMEISHIMVDPTDVFPSPTGAGTVEAFIGGKSIEHRFQVSLYDLVTQALDKNEEALDTWQVIQTYFKEAIRAIYDQYRCKVIIIGGKGGKDLALYASDGLPCPIIASGLGELAGVYGAARIGLDHYNEHQTDWE